VAAYFVYPYYIVHASYIDPSGNNNFKAKGMIEKTWADGTSWTLHRKLWEEQ